MSEITLHLPILIKRKDYHEFAYFQSDLLELGLKVFVEEVGFDGNVYVGLVHSGELEHQEIAREMRRKYSDY